ncbi:hypothetical protein [Streptomyces sp. NPDC058307]|uniref:hypothetical protein n=1 Tax=Streptomyces sp. NPDC058307 TaxID=3346439 RepID=UPI0036ECC31C
MRTTVLGDQPRRLAYQTETVRDDETTYDDVRVRELRTGRNQLVTRTLTGEPLAEGYSAPGAFARDGRLLAFFSTSPDLVRDDTNGVGDGFLRHLR